MEQEQKIFKRASTTYYFTSRFFPKKIREDVFRLYSFVRTADDYVDKDPKQTKKLLALEKSYESAIADHAFDATAHRWDDVDTRVIKHIVRLQHKHKFESAWVKAFFAAMKSDIEPAKYQNLEDSLKYVHGSAEVIGLMMARIMDLPTEAHDYAVLQGRAMQWINFIRDIAEDTAMKRCYFPQADLKKFGLKDLTEETARANQTAFKKFVAHQLKQYFKWQEQAEKGFEYIPERLRVPIVTAAEMYVWTAEQIAKDPFIVYKKQVKPTKRRVIQRVIKNTARGAGRFSLRSSKQATGQIVKIRPMASKARKQTIVVKNRVAKKVTKAKKAIKK